MKARLEEMQRQTRRKLKEIKAGKRAVQILIDEIEPPSYPESWNDWDSEDDPEVIDYEGDYEDD